MHGARPPSHGPNTGGAYGPFTILVRSRWRVWKRRRLVAAAEVEAFFVDVSDLALTLDHGLGLAEMLSLRKLATRYNLNIYDAAYLELALRSGLPLATRDEAMAQAARMAGATLFTI